MMAAMTGIPFFARISNVACPSMQIYRAFVCEVRNKVRARDGGVVKIRHAEVVNH